MNPTITIQESRDVELVWSIVHDPSVFDFVCDDGWLAKPIEELKAIIKGIVENPRNHIPVVFKDGVAVGCFVIYQIGMGIGETHTFLTEKCRGSEAIQAGKMAMKFIFSLGDIKSLMSFCPANLPQAYFFARRCGWRYSGVHASKWIKKGVEYEIKIVEATKEDLCR